MPQRDGFSTTRLFAPFSGVVVPLDEVPDPAFAQRLAGDGIAIDPLDQKVVAPCDARVLQVHRAGHALTLSAFGLEILIHVGLDTVKLNGKGFKPNVKAGDNVRKGDTLLTFDADYIATHAPSLISPVLVTNMDRVTSLEPAVGLGARWRPPDGGRCRVATIAGLRRGSRRRGGALIADRHCA